MPRFLWLILFSWTFFSATAQDTLYYDIIVSGLTVGEFKVFCHHHTETNSVNYFLDSKINVKPLYCIEYQMESEFKNNEMTYSRVTGFINNKEKYCCCTQKQTNGYKVTDLDGKTHTIKGKITNGMTGIYNARPQVGDSIFSEYAGIFKPFTQLNDSTYVLSDPGSRHQSFYYYKNGIMIKGKMPNAIMDFYFVLRSTR